MQVTKDTINRKAQQEESGREEQVSAGAGVSCWIQPLCLLFIFRSVPFSPDEAQLYKQMCAWNVRGRGTGRGWGSQVRLATAGKQEQQTCLKQKGTAPLWDFLRPHQAQLQLRLLNCARRSLAWRPASHLPAAFRSFQPCPGRSHLGNEWVYKASDKGAIYNRRVPLDLWKPSQAAAVMKQRLIIKHEWGPGICWRQLCVFLAPHWSYHAICTA